MFDERTNKRAPKQHVLKVYPKAKCVRVMGQFAIVDPQSDTVIGDGRSAWHAWMDAEIKLGDHP